MKILTSNKCKECDGTGRVYNDVWRTFNELDDAYKEKHGQFMSQKDVNAWFRERGYGKLPGEELICYECEGNGIVQEWKSIEEIASMILNIGIHNGHIKP